MKKIILSCILANFIGTSFACTAVDVKAKDGSMVAGRTMEWAYDMQWQLVSIPKGSTLILKAPASTGLNPVVTNTKYAVVGIAPGAKLSPETALLEGQNSSGLGLSGNFLPGFTQYQSVNKNDKHYMSILELGTWILGNFATVAEVSQELPKYKVWADASVAVGPTPPTLHLIITDKSGANIVVEYVNGELHMYNKTANVLTNAPTYDWHMINLHNYIALTNKGTASLTTQSGEMSQLSQGIGMYGLPGDYTASSRFVRTVFLNYYADKVATDGQAVQLVGHILNNVDIPLGAIKSSDEKSTVNEYTQWINIKDLSNNKMYFADYNHRLTYVSLDLNKLYTKKLNIPISSIKYPSTDISDELVK